MNSKVLMKAEILEYLKRKSSYPSLALLLSVLKGQRFEIKNFQEVFQDLFDSEAVRAICV